MYFRQHEWEFKLFANWAFADILSSMESISKSETITKMRNDLKTRDPLVLADHTGSTYHVIKKGKKEFHLRLLKDEVIVTFPDFTMINARTEEVIPDIMQALFLYYFLLSDGKERESSWISLSELPDGGFYKHAYQGYTGNRLVRAFKNDLEAFKRSALSLGGVSETFGDLSFSFQALPRLYLMAVYWGGDEEFSPSSQVLFDASASHYLPTDMCAFVGSVLTEKLIKGKVITNADKPHS